MKPDMPTLVEKNGHLVIRIPMHFKRIGGRKEIIMPHGNVGSGGGVPVVQKPLALALARAHRWKDLLEQKHFPSISALASTVGQDSSYVMRILRLTYLAPDIIEAIMSGDEPSGLSLERLTKTLSIGWEEQRAAFLSPVNDLVASF
jgi:hypothetical protein